MNENQSIDHLERSSEAIADWPNVGQPFTFTSPSNCTCDEPEVIPSTGCPSCWTCGKCGKFGGCFNQGCFNQIESVYPNDIPSMDISDIDLGLTPISGGRIREQAYYLWVNEGRPDGEQIVNRGLGPMRLREYHWLFAQLLFRDGVTVGDGVIDWGDMSHSKLLIVSY